ncbi:tetratricopeptide repeat-containing sensor histidine kinase [Aequorivita echinoideorum]|uniref:histidine kinase n=1 Tax=Aequorivita echinoideorum TaxID=1549647 RepID=A0ABS5S638_9FLAO|nr:tetratricopeptide repeat-containing sensor histidine kinase [Aequorivita echinoideorum]MBT0607890.1 tetratricopeptide repeat protein [Aequorivita echinoideorum]
MPTILLNAQNPLDSTAYYYNTILNPKQRTDIPNAIQFYNLQKEKHLKENKVYKAIADLRLIAIGQLHLGESNESENTVVAALKLIDASPQSDTIRESRKGLYNQLGKIYRSTLDYNKALSAYDSALQFSKTEIDSITIHNNRATIHKDAGNYRKALDELKLALAKNNIHSNPVAYAMVLNNLGFIQSQIDDPQALQNLEKALQIREESNYLPGRYSSYHDLAEYYFQRNEKETALLYAGKAYEVAKTLNSISYLEDALSLFAVMSENPEITAYKTIRDSLEKQRQLAQNKYASVKYNVEKEQKKTAEAELEREKEKSQKRLYLFLVIAVGLVAIIIFKRLHERHKREKRKQIRQTEARISKKIHDELANGIYQVMDQVQMEPSQKAISNQLYKLYSLARDLSRNYAPIDTSAAYPQTLEEMLTQHTGATAKLILAGLHEISWGKFSAFQKETLYRVLQELMVNMKKHSAASLVAIRFEMLPKALVVHYSDNGKGVDFSQTKKGLGLAHVENRMENIKGQVTFGSKPGEGFLARLEIPL